MQARHPQMQTEPRMLMSGSGGRNGRLSHRRGGEPLGAAPFYVRAPRWGLRTRFWRCFSLRRLGLLMMNVPLPT